MNTILTLQDVQQARHYYDTGVWQDQTLYSLLLHHAEVRPDSWAVRDSARRITWTQLLAWTDAVAADLASAGLHQGSRVSVWMPSRIESIVILLACSRNGYICNPSLHQNYTVAEITRLIEQIDCEALFVQQGYGADAQREGAVAEILAVKSLRRTYWLTPERIAESGFPPIDGPRPQTAPDLNADKVVYLAFTSGSTGLPKAVMHSDNTLLANGRALVKDWALDASTVIYTLSPVSHHIATVAIEQVLVAGTELVLHDLPAGVKALDRIIDTGATYVLGVPAHALDIRAEASHRGLDKMGNVKVFYMAGAAIPRDVAQGLLDRGIVPQNVYGMTENGSHQYTLPSDSADTIVGTCGRSCDAYEIRIWDQENPELEVKRGEIGEIGGRGGCLMLGYFNNQKATEKSFNSQGWFLSGDLGLLDENGCLIIMGRKKDLIIRGGHNIYPSTIEDLAVSHPAVLKAAAFPIADDRLGEKVCLAVTCDQGVVPPTGEQMLQHLSDVGLSKYDMPEYYIVVEAFPLTASGKILKRELVEWGRQGRIVPAPVRWNSGENKLIKKAG